MWASIRLSVLILYKKSNEIESFFGNPLSIPKFFRKDEHIYGSMLVRFGENYNENW
jgi:hypothetical protein